MSLATLHLTGVPVAGVAAAGLADSLHQVAVVRVDVRAGEELPPRPSPHLTPAVRQQTSGEFGQLWTYMPK